MSHPRWPGYNTKTGNPVIDNASRRDNKALYRMARGALKFTGYKNRKRKKQLWRVEGGNYIQIVASVASGIARERAARTPVSRNGSGVSDTETGDI